MERNSVVVRLDGGITRDHTAQVELSVVVPFYNPGPALKRTVAELAELLRRERVPFEVIAVCDGSTDNSASSLFGIGSEVTVLRQKRNQGKGAAVRRGFAHARGRWIGFIDADGDIAPKHVLQYFRIAQAGGFDVVYGDKRHQGSRNESTVLRRLVSLTFSGLVSTLFQIGVKDTQTGCKMFSRSALHQVLPHLRERRFALDLELFVAIKAVGLRNVVAVPVTVDVRVAGSTVSTRAMVHTFSDMLGIFGRRLRKHYAMARQHHLHLSHSHHRAEPGQGALPGPRASAHAV